MPVWAAATAAIGAAKAAAAKSIATLFNFFIDCPLKESRSCLRNVRIGSKKTWQLPGLASVHHRPTYCARGSSVGCILARLGHAGALYVAPVLQPAPNRISPFYQRPRPSQRRFPLLHP
jgi:hypothetical protein